MGIETGLGQILLLVKNAVFYVAAVLTALVIVGNELRRFRLTFRWLEERQQMVRRSWYLSIGLYALLAILYAYLEHRPTSLILDVLTLVLLVGSVVMLDRRHAAERQPRRPRHAEDDDRPFRRRRPDDDRPSSRGDHDDEPADDQPRRDRRPVVTDDAADDAWRPRPRRVEPRTNASVSRPPEEPRSLPDEPDASPRHRRRPERVPRRPRPEPTERGAESPPAEDPDDHPGDRHGDRPHERVPRTRRRRQIEPDLSGDADEAPPARDDAPNGA